jgi:Tol biopolymer transport system component
MKIIRIALVAAALTMLVGVPALTQSGQDLFQQALVKEQAAGDLNGAIVIYQRIVRDFRSDRALAAKALVQLGQCYEKLGSTEARKAYQRVVTEYADQPDQLTLARARLAALAAAATPAPERPRFRKVEFPFKLDWSKPDLVFGGALSPDGKAFALSSEGAIWVVPVEGGAGPEITGEPLRVTPPMGVGDGFAWSADGNWIAFNLMEDKDGGQDIYVVSSRGSEPKRVAHRRYYRRSPAIGFLDTQRLSLSPNGRVLAFTSVDEDAKLCVATVSVDGGVPRCVTDAGSGDPAFAPDGGHIAYVQALNPKVHEVRVIPAGGGGSALVAEARTVVTPMWSPDGRMIAFLPHVPTEELWVVPVADDGRGMASPTPIKLPWSLNFPLVGWGANNRIGIESMETGRFAIYTVPASSGKATQITPEQVEPRMVHFPRWTPDGKTIWVLYASKGLGLGHVPSGGGTVTEVSTSPVFPVPPGGGNVISPDGKTVVFAGGAEGVNLVALWTLSTAGGQPTQLTKGPRLQDRYPCWTPDGKSVLFVRDEPTAANIYIVPAEGGEARPITSASDRVSWASIACSPDGRSVAYFAQDEMDETAVGWHISKADTIKIRALDGGSARVIAKVAHDWDSEEVSWSPDGRRLAYSDRGKILVVSVDGGQPVEIPTGLEDAYPIHVAWSPDGSKIAFTGVRGRVPELWVMEDFLPLLKAQQRK